MYLVQEEQAEPKASEQSLAEAAGETLGTIVLGLENLADEVEKGYRNATDNSSNQAGPSPGNNQEEDALADGSGVHWTPAQLGEAMAIFVLELDSATAGKPGASASEFDPKSAAQSLEEFLEAYRRELGSEESTASPPD